MLANIISITELKISQPLNHNISRKYDIFRYISAAIHKISYKTSTCKHMIEKLAKLTIRVYITTILSLNLIIHNNRFSQKKHRLIILL
jgi:hypothetical protein